MSVLKRVAVLGLGIVVAVAVAGCSELFVPSPWSAPAKPAADHPPSFWMGKDIGDASAKLGPPTSVMYNHGTLGQNDAGKTYVFASPGQPHYIFETGPGSSVIISAQAMK